MILDGNGATRMSALCYDPLVNDRDSIELIPEASASEVVLDSLEVGLSSLARIWKNPSRGE